MSNPIGLEAREFKLLLVAERFAGKPSAEKANDFWEKKLRPIVEGRLDRRGQAPRSTGGLTDDSQRTVRFWDTGRRDLTLRDYAFRQRGKAGKPDLELTLKFRTPDLFLAAATALPGSGVGAKSKFEEDVAPLQVAPPRPGGLVTVAHPRSIRSRFARSTKVSGAPDWHPRRLEDLFDRFTTLEQNLEAAGGTLDRRAAMRAGPAIQEHVFEGGKVELGSGTKAEFCLTFWRFAAADDRPDVAEISFKCKLQDGRMRAEAARRALRLFIALQEDLGDWVNPHDVSKTSLALPR